MKPHRFRGSGPGFPCQYVEGREACNLQVNDPVHVAVDVTDIAKKVRALAGEPREQFWPGSAMSAWQAHSEIVLSLIKKKSEAYGNAWIEQGYMGNLARILSKGSRLKNLLWRNEEPEITVGEGEEEEWGKDRESVLDTLYDLSALCAFAITNIEEGNRWGRS